MDGRKPVPFDQRRTSRRRSMQSLSRSLQALTVALSVLELHHTCIPDARAQATVAGDQAPKVEAPPISEIPGNSRPKRPVDYRRARPFPLPSVPDGRGVPRRRTQGTTTCPACSRANEPSQTGTGVTNPKVLFPHH